MGMMPSDLKPTSTMTSVGGDFEDRALDDFAFRDVAEAVVVKVEQAGVLG